MHYPISLQTAGLVVGAFLLLLHLLAFSRPEPVQKWLRAFPRSRVLGVTLLSVAAIWTLLLLQKMDLGEFARFRHILIIATLVAWGLTWKYVEEFLAVRSLGMLAMLAADILLDAAFLQPETSRLLLVGLAYVWILLGLFWVGMPFLLRDQITWVTGTPIRWKVAALTGAFYGLLLIVFAFTW